MGTQRCWVVVASRDHARRGVSRSYVMANHGKRPPLARMSRGDRVLIYSPRTAHPDGDPLKAITVVGEVTGDEPEPSDVIVGGFQRAAALREVEPLALEKIRDHLPAGRIRYGFFELDAEAARQIWSLLEDGR